ncbi:MAG: tryptophan 7-halogenase, partial [Maricaulis sp.]|nr:tryptophan 7-halogenase [Maricaulis sp.]
HAAGWQWRIPLQHRMGNGHVYASGFMDEDEAESILRANIEGELIAEPRPLRFTTGRRKQFWAKNCISVGLASGFLEPLESTSIHPTQLAITNFIELLPVTSDMSRERDEYNTIMAREFERVRDFLILHYHVTRRQDSEFWNYVRTMEIPASLQEKIDLYSARGRVARYQQGLFLEPSWLAVYLGQGLVPGQPDPSAAPLDLADLASQFKALDQDITAALASMPGHDHRLAEMLETVSHTQ